MESTALDLGATGKDNVYGSGLVNAAGAVVGKPSVSSISWCTNANITSAGQLTNGACAFTATGTLGVAPYQYRFRVTYSNAPTDTTWYDWGSATRDIAVPLGDYTLTVDAMIRESVYLRVGYHQVAQLYVCTGEALQGGETPNGGAGCGGGGEENLRVGRISSRK
jgi:hypothetical protein